MNLRCQGEHSAPEMSPLNVFIFDPIEALGVGG